MCTLIILNRVHRQLPVVIAANRDEYHTRAATPPRLISSEPPVLAGRDERGGGTWLGVTARGRFVGLTNQRTGRVAEPGRRSRGQLVLDLLRTDDADAMARLLESLAPGDVAACNILFGSADEGLRVAYLGRSDDVVVEPVAEGIHVLPNDRLDSVGFTKVSRARELVGASAADLAWPALQERLAHLLADHRQPPLREVPRRPPGSLMPRRLVRRLDALCVHTFIYGTRSSSIVALEPGRVARYVFADGPPCRASFEDVLDRLEAEA